MIAKRNDFRGFTFRVPSWVFFLAFAISVLSYSRLHAQAPEAFSPSLTNHFGLIFKIDSYEFVEVPQDSNARMGQTDFLILIKSINGAELKEPKLINYGFSPAIEKQKEKFDQLMKDAPPIFGYETLSSSGRPMAPHNVEADMENWYSVDAPGFRIRNTLEIVDAKGLEIDSVRSKMDRISQGIRRVHERAEAVKLIEVSKERLPFTKSVVMQKGDAFRLKMPDGLELAFWCESQRFPVAEQTTSSGLDMRWGEKPFKSSPVVYNRDSTQKKVSTHILFGGVSTNSKTSKSSFRIGGWKIVLSEDIKSSKDLPVEITVELVE